MAGWRVAGSAEFIDMVIAIARGFPSTLALLTSHNNICVTLDGDIVIVIVSVLMIVISSGRSSLHSDLRPERDTIIPERDTRGCFIQNIDCRYINTFEKIDFDIDMVIFENIDIVIDIDKAILENIDIEIDIDKAILKISISISISIGSL